MNVAYAFVDDAGLPGQAGSGPSLPKGAVLLPDEAALSRLGSLMLREGVWTERPALPKAEPVDKGFTLGTVPDRAEIVVTDLGTGLQMLPAAIWKFTYPLPEDGTFQITVTAPLPWLPSSITIRRGKGSPGIAARALAQAKTDAITRINRLAGELRLKVYTDIPGQDAIYLEKRAEALAWVASAKVPDLKDFPLLAGEIGPGLTASTPYELAQIWLNRSHLFKLVGGATETARLRATYAIATAPDETTLIAIEQGFIEALARLPI